MFEWRVLSETFRLILLGKLADRHGPITRGRSLSSILVAMEACGNAHYWARQLEKPGHQVKLMAPQFVKQYVKTNKNDAADAGAICEAVSRPNMRFVPIKNAE